MPTEVDPCDAAFGAAGDGVKDDQAALAAAIAAVPPGGLLKVPAGKVFRFHDLTVARSDLTIDGPGTLLSTFDPADVTKRPALRILGSNVHLRNFTLRGVTPATQRPASGIMDLIAFGSSGPTYYENGTAENLTLEGGFTSCLNFYRMTGAKATNVRTRRNLGNAIGFVQCPGKVMAVGNDIYDSQDDGIAVTSDPQLAGGTQEVTITGNVIDQTDAKCIDLSGVKFFTIAGNQCRYSYAPAIMVWADTFWGLSDSHWGNITGNVIEGAGKCYGTVNGKARLNPAPGGVGNGIHLGNGASFVSVLGNQINGATGRGIEAQVSSSDISHNQIYDTAGAGLNVGNLGDASRALCRDVTISHNLLRKVAGGIVAGSITDLHCVHNKIRGYRNGATGAFRGITYGNLNRALITGNGVVNDDGGDLPIIEVPSGSSVGATVRDNYVA